MGGWTHWEWRRCGGGTDTLLGVGRLAGGGCVVGMDTLPGDERVAGGWTICRGWTSCRGVDGRVAGALDALRGMDVSHMEADQVHLLLLWK